MRPVTSVTRSQVPPGRSNEAVGDAASQLLDPRSHGPVRPGLKSGRQPPVASVPGDGSILSMIRRSPASGAAPSEIIIDDTGENVAAPPPSSNPPRGPIRNGGVTGHVPPSDTT